MILEYSFRKSFLILSPPLKPDEQPIQQLLPPEISPSSLVRTYSFSQLKHNDSFKEQFNDSSIQLQKNPKLLDEMELKIQELKTQLKKQKQKRLKITEQHKFLDEKHQELAKSSKQKEKDETIKEQKKQLLKKIATLQQQVSSLKGEIVQKAQQLITYESRSEQSRRLLQKLNQNINKKESKLIKDKEAIMKELEEAKELLKESQFKEHQAIKELRESNENIDQMIQNRQRKVTDEFENRIKDMKERYERQLNEKEQQVEKIKQKMSQNESNYEEKFRALKQSMSQQQQQKSTSEAVITQLREQISHKDQQIFKLQQKTKELSSFVQTIQSRLNQTQSSTENIRQSDHSRINKLEIQIANYQYEAKQTQSRLAFLEEENQKMNVLVNQVKEDKKLLIREKEELKTLIHQKTLQIDSLRNKLQQVKENEIKHSSIIENYQKQQQRFYDQESRQTSTLASLEVKLKSNAIQIEKLNLQISQKQSELNHALKDLDKYKKLYKTSHQTLEMYKQQTHSTKEKTQQKWNELKAYYENQIALLQQRISQQDSINFNESRLKIKSLMTNEKAKINSSRLSINRGTPKSVDRDEMALKKQLFYKTNNQDQELKENYWHGLNNDSVEHSDQQAPKH